MINRLAKVRGDEGFTLIELLIVIVILGILAAIVVFAVNGITDRGQNAACASDLNTLRTAEEANFAGPAAKGGGFYASMVGLQTDGYLPAAPVPASSLHTITLIPAGAAATGAATGYTIANVAPC